MAKRRHKCLNAACHCVCDKDTDYCCDECEHEEEIGESCSCDHDECFPRSGMEDEDLPSPER